MKDDFSHRIEKLQLQLEEEQVNFDEIFKARVASQSERENNMI